MKPMFSYYGAKYKLAKYYKKPKYDLVIEPFAGSASYSLYYDVQNVILYDLNPVICSIWDYLIKVHEHEFMLLPVHFEHIDDLKICQEAKNFIGFWMGAGCVRPLKTKTPWGKKYENEPTCRVWSHAVKLRTLMQLKKIRNWKIYHNSYEKIPDFKAHWFVDPPYQTTGHKYKFSNIDYHNLAEWCLKRKGFVQVCENENANWLPFKNLKKLKSFNKRVQETVFERLKP